MKIKRHRIWLFVLMVMFIGLSAPLSRGVAGEDPLPDGFVYVDEVIPDVVIDLRYYTGTTSWAIGSMGI